MGKYQLHIPRHSDTLELIATGLGYAPEVKLLLPQDTITRYDFVLRPQAVALREVIVKATAPPIRASRDTVSYKVSAFTNGSEKVVEDVLRKLPGVQVGEDGSLSYKGKKVTKVLVEGDEFFGTNYKLISRNMPAGVLESVEAIQNYAENPLLRNIEESEKTVLNLTMKPETKRTTFGNARLGLGLPERYEAGLNLFSLHGKTKVGTVSNANTIGYDPVVDVEYRLDVRDRPLATDFETNPLAQLTNTGVLSPHLRPERYQTNQARMGALNATLRPRQNLKLTFWGYGFGDRTRQTVDVLSRYLLPGGELAVRDQQDFVRRPRTWSGNAEVFWQPTTKSSLRIRLLGRAARVRRSLGVMTTALNQTDQFTELTSDPATDQAYRIEYVRRLNPSWVWVSEGRYESTQHRTDQSVNSGRYAILPGALPATRLATQEINLSSSAFTAASRLSGTHRNGTFSIGLSFRPTSGQLVSTFWVSDGQLQIPLDTPFVNQNRLEKQTWALETQENYRLRKWRFFVGGAVYNVRLRQRVSESGGGFFQERFFATPRLGIGYQPTDQAKVVLAYVQQITTPNLTELRNGYILSNYRNFERGAPVFNLTTNHLATVLFSYNNLYHQFLGFANLQYFQSRQPYLNRIFIGPLATFSTAEPYLGSNRSLAFNSQADKYFNALRARLQVGFDYTRNQVANGVGEGEIRQNQLETVGGKLSFVTALKGALNFDGGISQFHSLVVAGGAIADEEKLRSILTKAYLSARVRPHEWFSARVSAEWIYFNGNTTRTNAFLLDASAEYHTSKSRWSFEFSAKNLLDSPLVAQNSLTNYLISETRFSLVPRFWIAQFEYKLGTY